MKWTRDRSAGLPPAKFSVGPPYACHLILIDDPALIAEAGAVVSPQLAKILADSQIGFKLSKKLGDCLKPSTKPGGG